MSGGWLENWSNDARWYRGLIGIAERWDVCPPEHVEEVRTDVKVILPQVRPPISSGKRLVRRQPNVRVQLVRYSPTENGRGHRGRTTSVKPAETTPTCRTCTKVMRRTRGGIRLRRVRRYYHRRLAWDLHQRQPVDHRVRNPVACGSPSRNRWGLRQCPAPIQFGAGRVNFKDYFISFRLQLRLQLAHLFVWFLSPSSEAGASSLAAASYILAPIGIILSFNAFMAASVRLYRQIRLWTFSASSTADSILFLIFIRNLIFVFIWHFQPGKSRFLTGSEHLWLHAFSYLRPRELRLLLCFFNVFCSYCQNLEW